MQQAQTRFKNSRLWKIAIDIVSIFLGFFVALAIRFEFAVPMDNLQRFIISAPAIVLAFMVFNSLFKIYSGRWKYASFDEILNLSSSTAFSISLIFVLVLLVPGARAYVPISVSVMGGVLALFVMSFVRLQFRILTEVKLRRGEKGGRKILLVGAGEAGETIARDMIKHPEYDYQPVAFVDDDKQKSRLIVQGIPVMGAREDIPRLVRRLEVDEIIITITRLSGDELREILPFCENTGAKIKILPGIFRSMAGQIGLSAVREVKVEDLLGRLPVETDLASISAYITDKAVMVTGAGGSIGSELSRQLSCLGPRQLLLLDNDETSLFELDLDLKRIQTACPYNLVVANIRDVERINSIFRKYRPQVVFHSAALKHVPMMEYHPSEAIKNNVMGTRNLAEASILHEVERFILISTDKAVQPVNVMGATKRIAEMLVKGYASKNHTLFTAVRFGNVLGSRGSVVPTFKKQIEEGGPVLVTHPDMTRYFMTIPEAAQLVIQAGAFAKGDDIFILDMGEPVRIVDLANEMIRLMGREKDVEVKVTGLRPGEKLHEELSFPVEEMLRTPHPKIDKAVEEINLPENFESLLDELIGAATEDEEGSIRRLLAVLVPTYKPSVPGFTRPRARKEGPVEKRHDLKVVRGELG